MSNFKEFDADVIRMSKKAKDISSCLILKFTFITKFAHWNGIITLDELREFATKRDEFIKASKQLYEKLLHYHLNATLKHWRRNKLKELEEAF